jgi:hypothetical protein
MIVRSPPNRPTLLCAFVLVLVIALLPLPTPSLGATDNPLLQLDQADFILGDSPEPPPVSAAWQRQPFAGQLARFAPRSLRLWLV